METKSKYIIFYCFLIILISSCATIKRPNDFVSILDEHSIEKIEGTYKNLAKNSNMPFWERFSSVDIIKHRDIIHDKSSIFKVEIEADNKIKFELYRNDKLELTETLEYSYHNKGIAIKGKSNYRYQGVPLIFFRYESQALWFSKDKDDELFLSFNGSASGGIFILIFGTPILGEARFEKIAN